MSIRFGRSGNGYDSSQVMETADDDWRQITDLAERRKIQNRLAQRNYRRKLRQRLEELERQAGEHPSTSNPKPKPSPNLRNGITSSKVTKSRARANSARTIRTNSDEWRLQVPRTQSTEPVSATTTVSDVSPITPNTHYSLPARGIPRNYYGGDFGPLPSTAEVQPSLATAGRFYPDTWESEQYYQHGNYSARQNNNQYLDSLELQIPSPYTPNDCGMRTGAEFSNYSTNPTVELSRYHTSPSVPRDQFYLAVNYNKLTHATIQVGKIYNEDDGEMIKKEEDSPFIKPEPWSLPENLRAPDKQLGAPHLPYTDMIQYRACGDNFLNYLQGDRINNCIDEGKICSSMAENWGAWGEAPWESDYEGFSR